MSDSVAFSLLYVCIKMWMGVGVICSLPFMNIPWISPSRTLHAVIEYAAILVQNGSSIKSADHIYEKTEPRR